MAVGLARDLFIVATLVAVAVILILVLYVCATFSYSLSQRSLLLRWQIFGRVPFGSRTIDLDNIQEARTFRPVPDLLGGYIFGNIPGKGIVTLVLQTRIFLMKRVFITPDDPASFLAELHQRSPRIRVNDRPRGGR